MSCSSNPLTISLCERLPWLYDCSTEKKTLPISLEGFSMVVPVARMSVIRPTFSKQTYTQQVTELEPYSLSSDLDYVLKYYLNLYKLIIT